MVLEISKNLATRCWLWEFGVGKLPAARWSNTATGSFPCFLEIPWVVVDDNMKQVAIIRH
jgi:hypothetical protein